MRNKNIQNVEWKKSKRTNFNGKPYYTFSGAMNIIMLQQLMNEGMYLS